MRASVQPTFVRFVFEMPDGVGVSSVLNDQKLTLLFNGLLTFDLADAKEAAPSNIASINQKIEGDQTAVEVTLIGDVDVHSFREEKNYIIDVAFQQAEKPSALPSPAADASHAPAAAAPVPAAPAAAAPAPAAPVAAAPAAAPAATTAPEKPAAESAAQEPQSEIARPTSETIAQQAKIEIKPETAPKISPAAEPPKQEARGDGNAGRRRRDAAKNDSRGGRAAGRNQAAAGNRGRRRHRRHLANQRRPEPDVFLCRRDARGIVSSRRHGVAGVRCDEADRCRADPQQRRVDHRRRQPVSAGQGAGDPHSPQPPAIAVADRRRRGGRHELDADICRYDANAERSRWWRYATSPIPRPPMSPCPWPRPAIFIAWSIRTPAIPSWWSTAAPPVRGFIKRQDFVELSLLESIHGVAVRPNSDDITTELASDKIVLGRPGGLTLSSAEVGAERATTAARPIFDAVEWRKDKEGRFIARGTS